MQRRDQVFFRNRPLIEELLHELVVALGHQLHQLFVRFLRLRFHAGRNLRLFAFAISTQVIGVALHAHQIDHAA